MENNSILQKLDGLEARFEEVSTLITDPDVIADQQRFVKLTKEYKDLGDIMDARKRYIACLNSIKEAKDILANETDPEMKEMAREELATNEELQRPGKDVLADAPVEVREAYEVAIEMVRLASEMLAGIRPIEGKVLEQLHVVRPMFATVERWLREEPAKREVRALWLLIEGACADHPKCAARLPGIDEVLAELFPSAA